MPIFSSLVNIPNEIRIKIILSISTIPDILNIMTLSKECHNFFRDNETIIAKNIMFDFFQVPFCDGTLIFKYLKCHSHQEILEYAIKKNNFKLFEWICQPLLNIPLENANELFEWFIEDMYYEIGFYSISTKNTHLIEWINNNTDKDRGDVLSEYIQESYERVALWGFLDMVIWFNEKYPSKVGIGMHYEAVIGCHVDILEWFYKNKNKEYDFVPIDGIYELLAQVLLGWHFEIEGDNFDYTEERVINLYIFCRKQYGPFDYLTFMTVLHDLWREQVEIEDRFTVVNNLATRAEVNAYIRELARNEIKKINEKISKIIDGVKEKSECYFF